MSDQSGETADNGAEASPRLVDVWESEDSEEGWAQGHIEPALMVLSAVANRMTLCGGEEAFGMLMGGHRKPERDEDETWASIAKARRDQANGVLASVRYVWLREDPDNEERMIEGQPGEAGYEEWTRVDLPW